MFYVIVKWQVIFPKKMFYHAVIILRSVPVILQCSIFKVNVLSGGSRHRSPDGPGCQLYDYFS